jgi:antibiotic biosynthesis monooxygenase (ABM) superfamily enzyme
MVSPVTIVTQTRVLDEHAADFAQWQLHVNDAISTAPGYLDGELIPPSPPVQLDWVIVQRFATHDAARDWLNSETRAALVEQVQPWLVGSDDVHVFEEDVAARAPVPVSTVISTPVQPGNEERYRAWQRKISAVQMRFPGFQGYKLQPPSPGITDEWVTILRFDSQANLDAWLSSAERLRLTSEAEDYTGETRIRTVKTGFDAWFPTGTAVSPTRWKQNMTVLLVLYPVVFLFGRLVGGPVFEDLLEMPFWLSLFLSNAASVVILSFVVPRVSKRLGWWLSPAVGEVRRVNGAGVALVAGLYGVFLVAFWLW